MLAERAPDLHRLADTTLHGNPQHVVGFHHGHHAVRIYLDADNGLPSATEAVVTLPHAESAEIAWNAWGDVLERTEYANWDRVDGLRYPRQWDVSRNSAVFRTLLYSGLEIPPAVADDAFALPPPAHPASRLLADDLALGQAVARAPDPSRPIEEIYPGIVQIPGSWYVTLVRQDDGVVVLDAPISAGYSRRVLEEAARRFPGVPVKAVVASTGFYWHIAGLREYAALGIPVYVRDRNESIVRQLLAAPHALAPDRLALHPRAPIIHPVSSCVRIGEGRNAIELMPVRRGEQAMVMSWIPQANLLHTAEMVQPLGPGGALLLPESLYEIARSVQEAASPRRD